MRFADHGPLEADLRHCRALLRSGSRSFHAAGLLLPRTVRDAFAAVYAFCRTADDAIDLGGASEATLAVLRARLGRIYAGAPAREPGDLALGVMAARHGIPRTVFDALLEGFAWEVRGLEVETLSDLYAYSARVASCVGAAVTCIMGGRDAETLARACDLGVAMQLTNVARDVGEDARAGRLFLPRTWMREEGIDPDAWLAAPEFSPELGFVVRRLLAAADLLYARAESGIARLPVACQPAIRSASLIYADIGRGIARAGYDSVSRRVVTSPARKAWLVARALAASGTAATHTLAWRRPPLSETRFLVEAAAR